MGVLTHHPRLSARLYAALIRPVLEYGIHLVPRLTPRALHSIGTIEMCTLNGPTSPKSEPARERIRMIHGLHNATTRCNKLAANLYLRVGNQLAEARERREEEDIMWRTVELRAVLLLHDRTTLQKPQIHQDAKRIRGELRDLKRLNTTQQHVHPSMQLQRGSLSRILIGYHARYWLHPQRVRELSILHGETRVKC